MVFTSTEKLPNKENNKKYIFLAGSIDSKVSDNWRSQVITSNYNQNHFFDPTNKNYEHLNSIDMKAHIQWELDALAMSDKIILQFLPDALSPISLVELGLYVSSKKLIVVCPKEFYKSRYVHTLCENYNTPIFSKMKTALTQL
jgi:hypothetical protein